MQALVSRGRKGTGWGPRGCLAPGSVGSWCPAGCVSPVPVITGQRGRECPVTQSPAGRDTPRGWEPGQPPAASVLGCPGSVGQAPGGSRSWNQSPCTPHGDRQPRAAPCHAAPLPTRLHPGLRRWRWGCGVPRGLVPTRYVQHLGPCRCRLSAGSSPPRLPSLSGRTAVLGAVPRGPVCRQHPRGRGQGGRSLSPRCCGAARRAGADSR